MRLLKKKTYLKSSHHQLPVKRLAQFRSKKFIKKILAVFIVFILFTGGAIRFLTDKAEAAWFDDNWSYRTSLTFTNNASDSNKKVEFVINTSSLISAGKMQSNCADSRFTDANGNLLQYYIDSSGGACNTTTTNYYVLMPVINNGSNVLYHYYGNPSAPAGTQSSQFTQATLTPSGGSATAGSEEKAPTPSVYWKFDEGYGSTVYNSIVHSGTQYTVGSTATTITSAGTVSNSTGRPTQNHIFYAENSGNWWLLYIDSTNTNQLKSKYSSDLVTWTAGATLTLNTNHNSEGRNLGVTYKNINGNDVVHIIIDVLNSSNKDTDHYRGTISGTTLTWGSREAVVAAGGTGSVTGTNLTITGSNRIQYADPWSNGSNGNFVRSTNTDSGSSFTAGLNGQTLVDTLVNEESSNVLFPMSTSGDDVFAIWDNGSGLSTAGETNLRYGEWTTPATPGTINSIRSSDYGAAVDKNDWSAVRINSNDIRVIVRTGSNTYEHFKYNGINWEQSGGATTPPPQNQTSKAGSGPFLATDGTDFFLFIIDSDAANTVRYNKFTVSNSTWSGWQVFESSTQTRNFLSGYQKIANNKIIVTWSQTNGSNFDIVEKDLDYSTSTYNGAISGATWQKSDQCVSVNCLYFDGSSSVVTIPNGNQIELDKNLSGGFTVSEWVYANDDGENHVGQIFQKGTNTYLRVSNQSGNSLEVDASLDLATTDATVSISNAMTINVWNHIEMTYDNGSNQISIYINGKLRGTSSNGSGSPASDSNNLLIGGSSSAIFHGMIDDFKIYNFVRSSAQILADFNAPGMEKGGNSLGNKSATSLTNGLVGYWKMDESSWATNCSTASVTDSSGEGNNGKPCPSGSAVNTTTGKFGNGGNFDGTQDTTGNYIDVPDNNLLDVGSSDSFTISAWVNGSSFTNDGAIIDKKTVTGGGVASDAGFSLLHFSTGNGGDIAFYVSDGTNQYVADTSSNVLNTNTWYLVTAVFDRNNTNTSGVYINGVRNAGGVASTLAPSGVGDASNSQTFRIGKFSGFSSGASNCFTGTIDEVRMYKRALSPSDVLALYNFAPGPVGYWKLDEGSGTTINDSSGYGHGAVWMGNSSTFYAPGKYGYAGNFKASDSDFGKILTAGELNRGKAKTVGAWFKTTASARGFIFSTQDAGATGYELFYQGGGLGLWASADAGSGFTDTRTDLGDGQWHYATAVWDGSKAYLYINGVLDATSSGDNISSAASETSQAQIGAGCATPNSSDCVETFDGQLDDVRVYNYARTQKQIVQDMNAGHPPPGSPVGSPLGYWKFDEGYGTIAHNSGNGGTALTGTLTNITQSGANTNSGSGWTTAGRFGRGINFEGTGGSSNDLVNMGSDSSIDDLTANPMTLSAWIYPNSLGEGSAGVIMAKNGNSTSPSAGWLWQLNTGNTLKFSVKYATTNLVVTTSTAVTLGAWNHVVLTSDGSGTATNVHMYINGLEASYQTQTSGVGTRTSDAANSLLIGNNNATGTALTFDGTIDEVKVFTAQLTSDQVKLDYNRGVAQRLGGLGNNSNYATGAENQEYCVPGDSSTCSGPVGRWDFEEGLGTSFNDSSGNGNTLTWEGATGNQWTVGKVGSALNFNGTNNDAIINPGTNLNTHTPTLEAWFKTTVADNSYHPIFYKNGTSTSLYALWVGRAVPSGCSVDANGDVVFLIKSSTGVNSCAESPGTTYNDGNWHFAAATYDGTTMKLYVDGVLVASTTVSNTFDSGNTGFSIGSDFTSYFKGQLDQARVFNYARTASQIAWDYNRGAPVAWYKMDECQGSTIHDSSNNRLDGTLTVGASGSQTSVGSCTTSGTAWGNGATGKINSSLNFDGTDDYVNIPDSSILEPNGGSWTVSVWANPGNANQISPLITKRSNSGGFPQWSLYICSDTTCNTAGKKLVGLYRTSATNDRRVSSTNDVADGQWHHYVMVADQSFDGIKLYVDGILVPSSSTSNGTWPVITNTDPVRIGNDNGSNYYSGQIDDARVFNYALTATQIKQLYNGGAAVRFAPNLGSP